MGSIQKLIESSTTRLPAGTGARVVLALSESGAMSIAALAA